MVPPMRGGGGRRFCTASRDVLGGSEKGVATAVGVGVRRGSENRVVLFARGKGALRSLFLGGPGAEGGPGEEDMVLGAGGGGGKERGLRGSAWVGGSECGGSRVDDARLGLVLFLSSMHPTRRSPAPRGENQTNSNLL